MRWIVLVIALALAACAPPFRAYTDPAPVASPGPATAAPEACMAPNEKLAAYETARETAALDAALRAQHSMLLTAEVDERATAWTIGSKLRGPAGERWLVVSDTRSCDPYIPLVAIDANDAVFEVTPIAKPTTTRTVALCRPLCGGCGIKSARVPVVVEVPAGAHLVPERTVPFPIDVQVVWSALDASGHEMMCDPVP